MRLVREDVRPSQIITRESIDNAIAGIAASGGSTNGVLHLLAIAWELGIPLTIDDFDTIAERTPIVASLTPGGRFVATDLHEAGGVAVMTRELAKAGLVHRRPQRRRPHAGGDRRGRARDPGPGGDPAGGGPAVPDRGPGDPARQPRARGLRS